MDIYGTSGNDIINGTPEDDYIDGLEGADTMRGGAGDDAYVVENSGDAVVENAGAGEDVVFTTLQVYTLPANVEHLIYDGVSNANFTGTGNALDNYIEGWDGNDRLYGLAGNDILDGLAGSDTLVGGTGNDVYVVDNVADSVVENAGEGEDTVATTLTSYSLGQNVENIIFYGDATDRTAIGNSLDNIIEGADGNDTLNGGLGADHLIGGYGDDAYVVDNPGDVVSENAGEGSDLVYATVGTYALAPNVEHLAFFGSGDFDGTGNALGNLLQGAAGNDTLRGGAGNDFLIGLGGDDRMVGGSGDDEYHVDGADVVVEAAGEGIDIVFTTNALYSLTAQVENLVYDGSATGVFRGTGNSLNNYLESRAGHDLLNGGAGNDTLVAMGGADRLIGGTGADHMFGGTGNDVYVVDSVSDAAIEATGEGADGVEASVSHTLAINVENLTLTGNSRINGTGNSMANILIGNAVANVLNGMAGADTMKGGAGDDTYIVDSIGDVVAEGSSAGADLVQSYISHTLALNVEKLTLMGTSSTKGTGNGLDNVIIGNSGANVLNGRSGADTMKGGAGNDTYFVDNAGDVVSETSTGGTDIVKSSVSFALGYHLENLTLIGTGAANGTGNGLGNVMVGNGAANALDGGPGADTLRGLAGNDTLNGGAGNDRLTGGTGADKFLFDTALSASANLDRIIDFSVTDDTIVLDQSIFTGLTTLGTMSDAEFHTGTAAQDADDRIIYDSATGKIYYDADGSGAGAQVLFAQVTAGLAITSADFLVGA